ncbi:dipeptide epimerase [Natrinema caseinilyticum]|uniref:dipeptide epimerase n=1 Tax=Natrinema caseinilyticum TaxID=2961570 RepID=UPI0020C259A3|nr:dipeptide epimerase [Natrinema caseinilyticum]
MSEIVAVDAEPLDLPLSEPFEIALGTRREASNVLVTVETADGTRGHGEGSPLPPVTGETRTAALETVRAATELLEGEPVEEYRRLTALVRDAFPGMVSATFALETAVLDTYCREREIPLSALFGGPPTTVETDLTVPILPPAEAGERAATAVERGYNRLKLKLGTDVSTDVERVAAVLDAVPNVGLKIDANQGWTPKETVRFADRLADENVRLELIEQPVPASDVTGLADVTRRVDVPIAADEAVFAPQDAVRIVHENAADIINVKPSKSGLLGAADIVSIARGADLELMIGCMLESAVGIHASAHLVAGSGAFRYVDLDGNRLLASDVVPTDDGPGHEIGGPGHGVTPDR